MKKFLFTALALLAAVLLPRAAGNSTLRVGPGKPYAQPCRAIRAAAAGDTIEIDSSVTYSGDVCSWSTNNLTIRGVGGGRAHIDAGGRNASGKGIWVIAGANTTIENIEMSGAVVPDHNGAGIRQEADNLTVRNCYFHNNEQGILTGTSPTSTVLVEFSEFGSNSFGDGFSHNIYIGHVGTFIFRFNYSHSANRGHLVKSRATRNFILYNRLSDEAAGAASYEIDFPNGGKSYVIGNLLQQGQQNSNPTLISYLEEGSHPANPSAELFVVNNSFANDDKEGTFVYLDSRAAPAVIRNNIFFGSGRVTNQTSAILGNNFVGDPQFVDEKQIDLHLRPGSLAIDAGAREVGGANSLGAFSLESKFQYVHPACAEDRSPSGKTMDIGAYEFRAEKPSTQADYAHAPPVSDLPARCFAPR